MLDAIEYSSYGTATFASQGIQRTGPASGDHLTYIGLEFDPESKTRRFGARYFDPSTGRFNSADPLGTDGGPNLYAYVDARPMNFSDPLGLFGTQSCAYYDQACSTNGGGYECAARAICRSFPKSGLLGPVSNCMRQCLQELHLAQMPLKLMCSSKNNVDPAVNADEHLFCAAGCAANPDNPYNAKGPKLPNRDISLP